MIWGVIKRIGVWPYLLHPIRQKHRGVILLLKKYHNVKNPASPLPPLSFSLLQIKLLNLLDIPRSWNLQQQSNWPCEVTSASRLQANDLFPQGHKACPDKEHAGVTLQSESGKVTGALPFILQQLVDVLLQKQLPFACTRAYHLKKNQKKQFNTTKNCVSSGFVAWTTSPLWLQHGELLVGEGTVYWASSHSFLHLLLEALSPRLETCTWWWHTQTHTHKLVHWF